MKKQFVSLILLCATALFASPNHAAITAPAGALPVGMPSRMVVGLFEQWGGTWMRDSAAPWDVRYAYFTKGWADNWGWGSHDGSMATAFFNECSAINAIPAVQFYQMQGEPGGGEGQFLQKAQNAATMATYFGDFKLLMQRAKDFRKPVVVMLEADGFAFLAATVEPERECLRSRCRVRDSGTRRSSQYGGRVGDGIPSAAQIHRSDQRSARRAHFWMGKRQGYRSLLGDRRVAARSRQGLCVSRTARIGRERDRRNVRFPGWRSAGSGCGFLRAHAEPGSMVECVRQRFDQLAQLQSICGMVAAVECEIVQTVAVVADSRRQLQSSERLQQRRVASGLQGQSARVFLRHQFQRRISKSSHRAGSSACCSARERAGRVLIRTTLTPTASCS